MTFEEILDQAMRVGCRAVWSLPVRVALPPLVGRERELALLQDRFAEVQAGRGQAVFLVGEAGIGKSRLPLEFRRYAEAAGARWLLGRCISYGHDMAYLPVLDLVCHLFGIQEADSIETIGTKIPLTRVWGSRPYRKQRFSR
jgi:hypothetical protein